MRILNLQINYYQVKYKILINSFVFIHLRNNSFIQLFSHSFIISWPTSWTLLRHHVVVNIPLTPQSLRVNRHKLMPLNRTYPPRRKEIKSFATRGFLTGNLARGYVFRISNSLQPHELHVGWFLPAFSTSLRFWK